MTVVTLVLPWPPSVNSYKKIGRIVRTKSGKLYQQRVNSDATQLFYWKVWQVVKPILPAEGFKFRNDATIRLKVEVQLYPPHEKRWDADNRAKVLLDALMNAKVIADDSQIYRLILNKMPMCEEGKAIVYISELKPSNLCDCEP